MERTRWKPNARFLILFSGVCIVVVTGGHFWYKYRVRCNADAFLDLAERHASEQNWQEAAKYYDRYLRLLPGEREVRVRLAETFDRAIRSPSDVQRATELYFQALALVPERADLRRRQAELLLQVAALEKVYGQRSARLKAALQQADEVLATPGFEEDRVAWNVKAVATHELFRLGRRTFGLDEVVAVLHRAIEANRGEKDHVALAPRLAALYRDERGAIYPQASTGGSRDSESQPLTSAERQSKADEVMNEMVEANSTRAAAFLARYRYRRSRGIDGVDEDLEQAMALSSKGNNEILNASVQLASASQNLPLNIYR